MAEKERGKIKSMLLSLLTASERGKGPPQGAQAGEPAGLDELPLNAAPAEVPQNTPPGPGKLGFAPPEGEAAPLPAGAALPEGFAPDEQQESDPDILPAMGNPLYELFSRRQGSPPLEDENLTFSLTQFMEGGLSPEEEQRGWFGKIEREAKKLLDKSLKAASREESLEEESQDASILVFVTKSRMQAYIFCFPPTFFGRAADEDMLWNALESAKVSFGIDEMKLHRLGEAPEYFRLCHLAEGRPAVDGKNGEVIDHFNRNLEIHLTVREDNTIDYKDLGWLQTITEGEAICVLVPPTEAVPGHDVTGSEVRGRNGQKATAPMGQNTKMSEDGLSLLATIEGVVTFASGRFRVDPILIIKGNVSTETGNIDTIGDILIHGDIQEGFTVQASGNITVQGMIEGATVMAGGDIQVGRGMNGNSHGVLQARGEVRSKFIENATVTAGGKITCDTIINSTISSDTAIEVTTGRGAIIGGQITALERITAKSIGNQSNRNIVITMGSTANLLREKYELEQKKWALESEVDETQKNLRFLAVGGAQNPENGPMADDLKLRLSVLKMQLATTTRSLEAALEKQVNSSVCRLRADVLYPPAQITIGGASKILRQMYFNATVYCNSKGEVDIANV